MLFFQNNLQNATINENDLLFYRYLSAATAGGNSFRYLFARRVLRAAALAHHHGFPLIEAQVPAAQANLVEAFVQLAPLEFLGELANLGLKARDFFGILRLALLGYVAFVGKLDKQGHSSTDLVVHEVLLELGIAPEHHDAHGDPGNFHVTEVSRRGALDRFGTNGKSRGQPSTSTGAGTSHRGALDIFCADGESRGRPGARNWALDTVGALLGGRLSTGTSRGLNSRLDIKSFFRGRVFGIRQVDGIVGQVNHLDDRLGESRFLAIRFVFVVLVVRRASLFVRGTDVLVRVVIDGTILRYRVGNDITVVGLVNGVPRARALDRDHCTVVGVVNRLGGVAHALRVNRVSLTFFFFSALGINLIFELCCNFFGLVLDQHGRDFLRSKEGSRLVTTFVHLIHGEAIEGLGSN